MGAVARELGTPAILVNNAGVFPRVDFLAMTEADWDHVLDVNLKGSFLCAQAAARRMVDAGLRRRHREPLVGGHARDAARRPLRGEQGRASWGSPAPWRSRWRPTGSASTRSRPGLTDTAQPRYGNSEAELVELGRQIPLEGRMARPEEIARVAVFLAAEESGWITGQTIHVNGGAFMGG